MKVATVQLVFLLSSLVLVQSGSPGKRGFSAGANASSSGSLGTDKYSYNPDSGKSVDRVGNSSLFVRGCKVPRVLQFDRRGACTRHGLFCVKEASCRSKKCRCPQDTYGDATLHCSPLNNHMCTLSADPHLKTYGGATADVSLPCSYCVTNFHIPWPHSGNKRVTHFAVQVNALNTLTTSGMYFVDEVSVKFYFVERNESTGRQTVIEPRISALTSTAIILSAIENKFPAWILPEETHLFNLTILNRWDSVDYFAVISVPKLDLHIQFRPPLSGQPQARKPGLVVRTPKNIQFFFDDDCVCLQPSKGPKVIQQQAKAWGLPDRHTVLQYQIFDRNMSEPAHNYAKGCSLSKNVFQSCGDSKVFALRFCTPLLKQRSLTKCVMRGTVDPVMLFHKCLRWTCQESVGACRDLFSAMFARQCQVTSLMRRVQCSRSMLHLSIARTKPPSPK